MTESINDLSELWKDALETFIGVKEEHLTPEGATYSKLMFYIGIISALRLHLEAVREAEISNDCSLSDALRGSIGRWSKICAVEIQENKMRMSEHDHGPRQLH